MDRVIQKAKFAPILPNEYVFKRTFADLTLQVFPDVWIHHLCLLVVPLAFQPWLETAKANVTHWSATLAGGDQLVLWFFLG